MGNVLFRKMIPDAVPLPRKTPSARTGRMQCSKLRGQPCEDRQITAYDLPVFLVVTVRPLLEPALHSDAKT